MASSAPSRAGLTPLRAFKTDDEGCRALVAEALEHAKAANRELRELAHGLLPDVLTTRGLAAGVESIADGLHVPMDVSVPDGRFPAEIEATANFLVAEALTNVAKHADARHANAVARVEDGSLPDRRLRRRPRRRLRGRKRAAGPPRSRRDAGRRSQARQPARWRHADRRHAAIGLNDHAS
jgi:hypothetical protein